MRKGSVPTISFVLGKPVRPDTVFPEVFSRLRAKKMAVEVHVPGDEAGTPRPVDAATLVVQRGLHPDLLRPVRELEIAGVRCCNRARSTTLLANRMRTNDLLRGYDLPVPWSIQLAEWGAVLRVADQKPVAVKASDGQAGRGSGVLLARDGRLPADAPFDGPYIVQDFIDGGDRVYKLYVAGADVRGLLKPSDPARQRRGAGVPFDVDQQLAGLAAGAGQVLELDIYGVDVLYGPEGPVIVDVNPFPGFRGVPDGPRIIADHLASLAVAA